jgi:CO/xanthine dehydrogenase Mo-binding subunit
MIETRLVDWMSRECGPSMSRRTVLTAGAAAGGSLMIGVGFAATVEDSPPARPGGQPAFVPSAFVRIDGSGRVTLTMAYVEMGQATYTSIPMLIAEELEVDLASVRLEHAPPNDKLYANPLLGFQATGGSTAIRAAYEPMRRAGATARVLLVQAAAQRWKVQPESCRA